MTKLFVVACETSQCYGHGDYGTEQRICRLGSYGSGDFPPLFPTRQKAEEWIASNKLHMPGKPVVVEMELRD